MSLVALEQVQAATNQKPSDAGLLAKLRLTPTFDTVW